MSDPGFLGLLREHIRTVWAMELLLLMRSRPEQAWRTEDLVRELRASTPLVTDNLERFERAGFVAPEAGGRWRFSAASPVLAAFCDQLAEMRQTRPVALINMIASRGGIQGLADAFKFRRGDEE